MNTAPSPHLPDYNYQNGNLMKFRDPEDLCGCSDNNIEQGFDLVSRKEPGEDVQRGLSTKEIILRNSYPISPSLLSLLES